MMNLYDIFIYFKELFDESLIEISVKQSQITFIFDKNEIIHLDNFIKLDDARKAAQLKKAEEDIWVTLYGENPMIILPIQGIGTNKKDHPLLTLIHYIHRLATDVCTCPSLEFIVAEQYIKFFLDKPTWNIDDFIKVKNIFNQGDETFEFHAQRPYILFVGINTDELGDDFESNKN